MANKIIRICWNLTSKCNWDCKFCYANKNVLEGNLKKQKQIISLLSKQGIKEICFSGGEPLLLNYLPELLGFAKRKGLFVHLSTNGSLLNEEIISKIANFIDVLSIPLDGSEQEIVFHMRGDKTYLKKFAKIIKIVENYKLPLRIFTLVTPFNKDDLLNIYNLLKGIKNLESWKLSNYYPVDKCYNKFILSVKDYENAVKKGKNIKSNFKIVVRFKDEKYQEKYFLLDPIGNLYTTTHNCHNILGNIFEESLDTLTEKA